MQYVQTRQCSLFEIFRIMCLLLLRILFQPVGKLPEQWDENQHRSHGSSSASVASGLCYFIQHWAFTALRYMKFTILMEMHCYIWIFGLSSDEIGSTHIFFSGTEIQYFLCHEVWIHDSTMPWFSWMISSPDMVLLFVILPKLSFIPVSFSVPVCLLPGIAGAMAPMRSCFLLCCLFSPALPGAWKK